MNKTRELKNQNTNGNGKKPSGSAPNQKESQAYKSAMKAFSATNKRLHPELYGEKTKRG